MNSFQGSKQVSRFTIDGEEYIFDLTKVQSLSPVGVDHVLFEATNMLGRAITMKSRVRTLYEDAKFLAHQRYWAAAAANDRAALFLFDEKQKPTASHLAEVWLDHFEPYITMREIRSYLDDLIQSLQMVYIPRLRTMAEGTQIAERQQHSGRPGGSYDQMQQAPIVVTPPPSPPTCNDGSR